MVQKGKDLQTEQYDLIISFLTEKRDINLKNAGVDPNLHVPDLRVLDEGKEAAKKDAKIETKPDVKPTQNPMLNQNSILNQIIPKTGNNDISIIEPSGEQPSFQPKQVDQSLLERVAGLVGATGILNEDKNKPPNVPPPGNSFNKLMWKK